jgi:hypothetical protein
MPEDESYEVMLGRHAPSWRRLLERLKNSEKSELAI